MTSADENTEVALDSMSQLNADLAEFRARDQALYEKMMGPVLTEAEATQRADEDEFLRGLRDRLVEGGSLTQDERDRMAVIQLLRG